MELPEGFAKMAAGLLGDESEAFLSAMRESPEVSVRLNSRKPDDIFGEGEVVAWCEQGRYLPRRPVFTLDPLLHAGVYYVQDASSMIYGEVVKRLLSIFEKEGHPFGSWQLSLLDLCAAPGGKTTAMIDCLPDNSRVTANEYVGKRAATLRENLTKWGFPVQVTNRGSEWFAAEGMQFDIVAVDAPCSGEGMMRKEPAAIAQWSLGLVEQCASLQREILADATAAVRPGGFLIYSTCTFNRKENEENLEYAVRELGLQAIELDFPDEWGIPRGIATDLPAWRFMPHKTRGEGLFLCVLRKPGDFVPPVWMGQAKTVSHRSAVERKPKSAKRRHPDSRFEKRGSVEEVPSIDEILRVGFKGGGIPVIELSREEALSYLRRESIILPEDTPKGIVIVAHKGHPLGCAKNIGRRANNLYPKEWRILMR